MELLGIFLALLCMVILSLKGFKIFFSAIVSIAIAMIFNHMPILETYREGFLTGAGGLFKNLFFVFFFGSILGKIYEYTGAAVSLAKGLMKVLVGDREISKEKKQLAVIAIVMITGIGLGYGGINVIVLQVALYPLVLSLMKEADIPKRHVVGLVLAAIATVGMTGPGTPQVQNLIPIQVLGTTSTAALVPGLIAAAFTIVANAFFLLWMFRRDAKKGLHFEYGPRDTKADENAILPNPIVSVIPMLVIFICFNIIKLRIEWSLLIGTVLAVLLLFKSFKGSKQVKLALNEGSQLGIIYVMNIAFMTGFGTVIKMTPAFGTIIQALQNIPGNPLVTATLATALTCGLTGSASGGLALILPVIAPIYKGLVIPAAFHRSVAIASSSIDTLPINGGFLMFCDMADLSVKEAYPTVFLTTVLSTSLATTICIVICLLFPQLAV